MDEKHEKYDTEGGVGLDQSQAAISGPPEQAASAPDQTNPQNLKRAPDATEEPSMAVTIQERIDKKRKEKGLPPIPRPPDRSGEVEEGTEILLSGLTRFVIRRPDNVVVKMGEYLNIGEVDAMRFAKAAGIPVPAALGSGTQQEGRKYTYIEMENIEGDTLESVWQGLDQDTRLDIAHQLRDILTLMRSLPPPPDFIGSCNSDKLRDMRSRDIFVRPAVRNEDEFTQYLTDEKDMPLGIKDAFRKNIGNRHRVVFSHCDVTPRNIMVRDNRIVALLDWEVAGWYPEYWEYVKFMHNASWSQSWKSLVDEIFPQSYGEELLLYTGLQWYQEQFDPTRVVARYMLPTS